MKLKVGSCKGQSIFVLPLTIRCSPRTSSLGRVNYACQPENLPYSKWRCDSQTAKLMVKGASLHKQSKRDRKKKQRWDGAKHAQRQGQSVNISRGQHGPMACRGNSGSSEPFQSPRIWGGFTLPSPPRWNNPHRVVFGPWVGSCVGPGTSAWSHTCLGFYPSA